MAVVSPRGFETKRSAFQDEDEYEEAAPTATKEEEEEEGPWHEQVHEP